MDISGHLGILIQRYIVYIYIHTFEGICLYMFTYANIDIYINIITYTYIQIHLRVIRIPQMVGNGAKAKR